jgi:hypothetical protein
MYKRWKEKPKERVWYDIDGIAHRVEPGSAREAAAIRDEEDMHRILSGVLAGEKHGAGGGLDMDDDAEFLDDDGVRISSMMDRRSSA